MDDQQTPRAAGYARALALFVLLVGVVIMHSAAFAPSSGGHHGATAPGAPRLLTHSADTSPQAAPGMLPSSAAMAVAVAAQTFAPAASGTSAATSAAHDRPDHVAPTGDRHESTAGLSTHGTAISARGTAVNTHDTTIGAHDTTIGASETAATTPSCTSGDCTPNHAVSHGCVFVLTALALALALAALYWVGWTRPEFTGPRPHRWGGRRARPPPWTVLTLAELAILRI
ncbi:hypothetical protein [Nocardia sp. CC201C]|uniref:hypothetical protein n=1 Tax=Nocardia sp. CC201C TaxID=3044575 RepID=UPI0024A93648|nr:hypothetical protein [Nocardia sp. CC201C]